MADDGVEANDLLEHRQPGVPGGAEVVVAELIVPEQPPRGEGDELTCGDHARGAVGDAFNEDVRGAGTGVEEVGDDVVARTATVVADGGQHVADVEGGEREEPVDGGLQPLAVRPPPVRGGEVDRRLPEERREPRGEGRDRGRGEADDAGGDADGVAQSGVVEAAATGDDGLIDDRLGLRLDVCPVPFVDDGRREEAGEGTPLLIMRGAVGDEDRVAAEPPAGDPLRGEAGLDRGAAGPEDLSGRRKRADPVVTRGRVGARGVVSSHGRRLSKTPAAN
ncbi:Uncharacterised protein [Mycobacteroides abscessus subsp. abscessus]|nr:Uncharacterised protein [Mycobacteroides abscessus subsp. abscessus]